MSLPSEGQSLSANQISSTYLNSLLRYNYFRFWNTNVRHIWKSTSGFNLHHFAIIGVLFCIRLPNFGQIGTSTAEIWRHIDFQNGGRESCCICFGEMADHPRTAFRGLNSVLKTLVCRIDSSEDIVMYRFWRFGLKLPIHGPFLEVFGAYFPHMTSSPIVETPKSTVLERKHIVWAIQHKNWCDSSTWARDTEKIQDNKKVTKGLYFPYLGGSPHWTDSAQKLHGEWCPRRNHVCQVSNWYHHALRFYRDSNFRFSYWFLHGPDNSAALMTPTFLSPWP